MVGDANVTCYRVVNSERSEGLVNIQTYSRAPGNTNIGQLLHRVAPSTTLMTTTSSHSAMFAVEADEQDRVSQLLSSLSPPKVIAVVDSCTFVVCLDFYSHPPGSPGMSGRTEVGELVYQSKYQRNREAGLDLAERAKSLAAANPILQLATGVATVPGSSEGSGAGQLLDGVVEAISLDVGIPQIDLWRVQTTEKPQKNINHRDGDDPHQNQRDTMVAGRAEGSVLVVDDLMRHGSSIREASRALRERGATDVLALVLAKDLVGTGGYAFPKG